MGVDLSTFLLLLLRMLLIFVRQKVFTNDACLPLCLPTKNSVFSKFLCRPPKSDPRGNRKWNRWSHNHHSQLGDSMRQGPNTALVGTCKPQFTNIQSVPSFVPGNSSDHHDYDNHCQSHGEIMVSRCSLDMAASNHVLCVSLWSRSAHCRKRIIEREFD